MRQLLPCSSDAGEPPAVRRARQGSVDGTSLARPDPMVRGLFDVLRACCQSPTRQLPLCSFDAIWLPVTLRACLQQSRMLLPPRSSDARGLLDVSQHCRRTQTQPLEHSRGAMRSLIT